MPPALFVDEEKLAERKSICESCPFASLNKMLCTKCGCCIPMKCRFKAASCPEGKWNKED